MSCCLATSWQIPRAQSTHGGRISKPFSTTELFFHCSISISTLPKSHHTIFCCNSVPPTLRPSMSKSSRKRRRPHMSSQKNSQSTHGGKVSLKCTFLVRVLFSNWMMPSHKIFDDQESRLHCCCLIT